MNNQFSPLSPAPFAPSTIKENPLWDKQTGQPDWKKIGLLLMTLLLLTAIMTLATELLGRYNPSVQPTIAP